MSHGRRLRTCLAAYFERFPEQATLSGVPAQPPTALTDNTPAAHKAWEEREDAWLAELKNIDPASIATSYMIGMLEIRAARDEAERRWARVST